MSIKSKIIPCLFLFVFTAAILAPLGFLYAADPLSSGAAVGDYAPLQPLPKNIPSGVVTQTGLAGYLQYFFWFSIVIAGVLAVLVITYGGILYMTSEAFGTKAEAKTRITMAIVGFLLAISSVLILTTINPDLLKFNLLVRPLSFTIPDISATVGTKTGCTPWADDNPAINFCAWTSGINALGQSTDFCRTAYGNNDFVNQPESLCSGTKPVPNSFGKDPLCCVFVFQKNGCSGSGVVEGYAQCLWSKKATIGNDCEVKAEMPPDFSWTGGSVTTEYPCAGIKPGGDSMDCCVRR